MCIGFGHGLEWLKFQGARLSCGKSCINRLSSVLKDSLNDSTLAKPMKSLLLSTLCLAASALTVAARPRGRFPLRLNRAQAPARGHRDPRLPPQLHPDRGEGPQPARGEERRRSRSISCISPKASRNPGRKPAPPPATATPEQQATYTGRAGQYNADVKRPRPPPWRWNQREGGPAGALAG